ncbi:hypothetical protein GJAV_G00236130 [Gymnothorax javanicus]|nr:hypothetical protein GJAV_G00236130 [Gymnothorax javanicus]
MGLTQTGGHSESEGCSDAEEANENESWREGLYERTAEVMSSDDGGIPMEEKEEPTEDQQDVFSLAFLRGVRVGCEEGINRNGAPKPAPLATVHEEQKPEKNNSRQKEETVVGDGGSKREGERGTERGRDGGGVPVLERAPVRAETEAGNHGEHDNDSAESPCETKDQPPQPKTTGVIVSQSGAIMEIPQDCLSLSDVCMKRTVERFSLSNMEMGRSEEHPDQSEPKLEIREEDLSKSDLPIERKEGCFSHTDWLKETSNEYFTLSKSKEPGLMAGSPKVGQIPISLSALLVDDEKLPDELGLMTGHAKYIQSYFFDCDVTSCSSTTETGPENGEEGRTFAVSAAAANLHSDSTVEAFHLPEDSWRTTFKQEVSPSDEQDQGALLANGTLSLVACHCPLSGLNVESDVWHEEDQRKEEIGTALSEGSHTWLLPNQDRAEALKHEPSEISQGDAQGVCTGTGANQENKGADSGSKVTEMDTRGSKARSDNCFDATIREAEVIVTDIDGCGARSDDQREESTVELVVTKQVAGGCDVQSEWDRWESLLGSEEELRCVDNEHSTLQVPHHHQAVADTAPESIIPVCSSSVESYGPPLTPVLELSLREEEYGDVGESMRNISEESQKALQREKDDVSMVGQEVSERKLTSDHGKDADGEQIHSENDSLHPSHLCAYLPRKEKLTVDPPESSLSLALGSTGTCGSGDLQGSGSDSDGVFTTDAEEYGVLPKMKVVSMVGSSASELLVSSSPNEDTARLVLPGCSPDCRMGESSWSCAEAQIPGRTAAGDEEEKHHVMEVPAEPSFLRCPARSPSPFRRNSWGPGKNPERVAGITQCGFSGGLVKASLPKFQRRSYSLEELALDDGVSDWLRQRESAPNPGLTSHGRSEERGSVLSLTEEHLGDRSNSLSRQISAVFRSKRRTHGSVTLPLTKSVSLLAINQRDLDGMGSFPSISASSAHSISEETPGAPRVSEEGKRANKVGRTFSYLRSKMYKKTKEKEKDKNRVKEGERDAKEKDKQTLNGHLFSALSSCSFVQCHWCHKAITAQQAFKCTTCNAHVHKPCRDALPTCTRTKMKLLKMHFAPPDSAELRSKSAVLRQQPWVEPAVDRDASRRLSGIRPFSSTNLSKSISISNIAGPMSDEIPLKSLRYLSQSTDSLNKTVSKFMESLTDEGTEIMDGQLLGEFEAEAQALEAESWTFTVDRKYLKQLRKDVIKRQDVIYELMRTEMHHLRTLRVVAEVYRKGMLTEVALEPQTAERVFPALDELLEIHSGFLTRLLELRREGSESGAFLIHNIGDVLVTQFSGSTAERMKTVYGKFCSHHKEALNFYKELYAKDKQFQAFIMRKMSSPVVRRQGIPEYILLVTQRITKYPVLLQRLLQHTKEGAGERAAVTQALLLVRQLISAVNRKVEQHELKQRLREVYSRMDARSVMRMQSGEMFAREDLLRGRTLLHHGSLQLRTSAGRLKEALALLLSDVFVFLQEKDQKYIFASLDQRSTVLSLHKLIVREVANEERGLFLIAAGVERPEMVEVLTASREERSAWIQLIQEAVSSTGRCEDEGARSESAEERRLLQVKEMRDQLDRKEQQISVLLMEKLQIFQEMSGQARSADGRFQAFPRDRPRAGLRGVLRKVGVAGTRGKDLKTPLGYGEGSLPDQQTTEICSTLKKVLHSVCHLHELLNELQTVVVQQDSIVEEQRSTLNERPSSGRTSSLAEQEKQRCLQRQRQEAADLTRKTEAHVAERHRRESEWADREQELREREARLLQLDKETQRGLGEVQREREELRCLKEAHQRDLEQLREAQRRLERDKEQIQQEQRVREKRRSRAPSRASEDSLQIPSPVERTLSSSPIRDALLRMGSLRRGRNLRPDSSNDSRNAPDGEGQSHIPIRLLQLAKTKQPKEKKEKKKKKEKKEKEQRQQSTDATVLPGSERPEDRKIPLC